MAKALKAHGIAYDQVDANEGLGGNWRRGVFKTTHIISSKRSTGYTDYPMPADYPDFPSAAQILAYLEGFARDHGLLEHLECERKVTRAAPLPDNNWSVEFENGEQRVYKGVVVCNGHHWNRRMPSYPGTFAGELIHSKDYYEPAQLRDKRVLVIGGGNSACDVACEAARVGTSCDWSLRSGYWFLPKTAFGRPLTDLPIWWMPMFAQRIILRMIVRMIIGDYRSYGLPHPNHRLFERHSTFGTEVLGYVRQGLIRVRPEIARYDGSRVWFTDGSSAEFDMIIAATGFHNTFPFLPPGLVEVKNDAAQIYSGAFPPGVRHLYIVGSNQPRNGFGSIISPAADLYARLFKLQDELPQPIGDILQWVGDSLPETNLLDPGATQREIWIGRHFTFLLRVYSWLMLRQAAWKDRRESHSSPPVPAATESSDSNRAVRKASSETTSPLTASAGRS